MSFTFAYYTWRGNNTNLTFNISDSYFYCESGKDVNISGLSPVTDYRSTSAIQEFGVNNVGRSDTRFSLNLKINSMDDSLKHESFKYKVMVDRTNGGNNCITGNGCEEVGSGNFKNFKVGMNTLVESVELPNNVRYKYYLFMYIDGNMSNPSGMQNSSMNSV